jgi:hypothetical protein
MQRIKIWTFQEINFRGLPASAPVCVHVEADGPFDIGNGWSAYVVTAPNAQIFVAEALTGALVGGSLEEVRADMAKANPIILAEQEAMVREQAPKASEITLDEWWSKLGCMPKAA